MSNDLFKRRPRQQTSPFNNCVEGILKQMLKQFKLAFRRLSQIVIRSSKTRYTHKYMLFYSRQKSCQAHFIELYR